MVRYVVIKILLTGKKNHTFRASSVKGFFIKEIVILLTLSFFVVGITQGQKKVYSTTGGELIFSSASAIQGGVNLNTTIRFSPVFNIQNIVHIDMG